ncbi:DNA/RNA nuclease SfsA [Dialister sp.]|uniref:DNA/RNA nuclease SfsA n=1 Tax=Dialister sp. TaxID=1955814 RepID=UPI002E80B504|nr:DNA/RNA nuclease SfsA [Dialister sp.]MEE3452189.1 DNA/RNA nuclease SfsA [Dialister sp.]
MSRKIYKSLTAGRFLDRPNRFVCHAEVNGKTVLCHMPNPGRMRELLFPGSTLYLTPNRPGLRTAFRVVGIEKGKNRDIFYLDTTKANDVAAFLVENHRIPGWEDYDLLNREVTMGDSRFDLLLGNQRTGEVFPVEVKSCSLAGEKGAMFPDAPTERGEKHLSHLVRMAGEGQHAGLLVLVHYGKAEWFLPNYHTDLELSRTFLKGMDSLDWKAAVIPWTKEFTMPQSVRLIGSSKKALEEEMGNAGDYMIVLRLEAPKTIAVGSLGPVPFAEGYYVYVGSAKRNLDQRMAHHRALRKKMHWHMDYLRKETDFVGAIPIRTCDDLEHDLARALSEIADWDVPEFGCSDCHCRSHLFGFLENPMHLPSFLKIEERFEIDRLQKYF